MNKRRVSRVLVTLACAAPMLLWASPADAESHTGTLDALKSAIADTNLTSTFTQDGPIILDAPLGAIHVSGTGSPTLTIYGGNYDLDGKSYSGITVSSTQTLNINNVGSLNPDGSVNTSWHGFSSTANGSVINNRGKLSIADSVFSGNSGTAATSSGGVLYIYQNASNVATTISGSTFSNNSALNDGGAIYNLTGILNITDTDFISNHASFSGGAIYNLTSATTESIIDKVRFEGNSAKYYGGAIYNKAGLLTITDTAFIGNYNVGDYPYGGAIYNASNGWTNYGVLHIGEGSSFIRNGIDAAGAVKVYQGGAIYNVSEMTAISTIDNALFQNNAAIRGGGAIRNGCGILAIADTDFVGNYTLSAGGAIFNSYSNSTSYGTLNIGEGAKFIGNGIDSRGLVKTGYGGAIYNMSTATIKDTLFVNNKATTSGGAIYNEKGALNIQASAGGLTLFGGNVANSLSNAIHMKAGTLNFNAGDMGLIIFDDKITSEARANAININDGTIEDTLKTGTVILNNTLSKASVTLNSGTLTLGLDGNTRTTTYLDDVNLTLKGGVLDMQNSNPNDTINIYDLIITDGSTAKLTIDADLANAKNDKITIANTATGILAVDNVKILTDAASMNSTMTLVSGGTLTGLTLAETVGTSATYGYIFTPNATAGVYDVLRLAVGGINFAVKRSDMDFRVFSPAADADAEMALGAMGKAGSKLLINGNNKSINGKGFAGMSIAAGQTLDIVNVGSLNTDGTVNKSFNGFSSTTDGGVINNAGNLSIIGSVFSGNSTTAQAGVLYNNTASDVVTSIFNSTFSGNYAGNQGGAIYNNNGNLNVANADFTGNYAVMGGAIAANNKFNISRSNFVGNGKNSSGSVISGYGGAIYKWTLATAESTIRNSVFKNNAAYNASGAIHNGRGILEISNTDFIGNYNAYASAKGGAIFNDFTGTLNIGFGSTFVGNGIDGTDTVKTTYGGAIYNDSGAIAITDTIFTGNKALTAGGAIYNQAGTLNIKASDGGLTEFSGNEAAGVSNAIHMAAGTLNLDSKANGIIRFDDRITSGNVNNIININSEADSLGSVIFNDTVSDSVVNFSKGNLQLGEFGNTTATNYLSGVKFTQTGGLLSMLNGDATDTLNLSEFNTTGGLFGFDVDLNSGSSDLISATAATGTLNLLGINVVQEGAYTNFKLFDTASPTLSSITSTTFTNNYKYEFNQDGAGGYNVASTALGQLGLNEAVESSLVNRAFSATDTVTLTKALGAMATDSSTLSIFGNLRSITGTSLTTPAISVGATQTLNIIGVGSLNGDGTVATSWTGFTGADGGAISNVGTLSVINSVFSGNSATSKGGVLYNNTAVDTTSSIMGSTFANNSATYYGGAIYNNSGILNISDTDFVSNHANTVSNGDGGAIYNKGGTLTITGTDFLYNYSAAGDSYTRGGAIRSDSGNLTINNSNFTGNYANAGSGSYGGAVYNVGTLNIDNSIFNGNGLDGTANVRTQYGGAIYNGTDISTVSTISNSVFENNAALYGGAIQNSKGILKITNTDFVGNYTKSTYFYGGAIYNGNDYISASNYAILQIAGGTTFTGNGKDSSEINITSQGGAIYNNTLATAESTIDNVIFESNIANNGGAIYNRSGILTITDTDFVGNYASSTGGAILNSFYNSTKYCTLQISAGTTFVSNGINSSGVITSSGGAIFNYTLATVENTIDKAFFQSNAAAAQGGAIYNAQGILTITDTDFIGNYIASSTNAGGAINNFTNGTLNISAGSTFIGNGIDGTGAVVTGRGGAIGNATSPLTASTIDNAKFENNAAIYRGGAIYNQIGILKISDTDFIGNYNTNSSSDVTYGGGAINNGNNGSNYGVLQISAGTNFIGNGINPAGAVVTTYGGAIENVSASAGISTIDNTLFQNNAAMYSGGAIYNGRGILKITDTDFIGNYGANSVNSTYGGGAIYNATANSSNYGTLQISAGSTFIGNGIDGTGTVKTYAGGAIYNKTLTDIDNTIYNTLFENNAAVYKGGAIYNEVGILTINDSDFVGNYVITGGSSYGGGAIFNANSSSTSYGIFKIAAGSTFVGNGIDGSGTLMFDYGGAIFNNTHSSVQSTIDDSLFQNNAAKGSGGAIQNTSGKISINNTDFIGNYTTAGGSSGGAIVNGYNGTLAVGNSSYFCANGIDSLGVVSTQKGGAISNGSVDGIINTVDNTEFYANASKYFGGAVYNYRGILQITDSEFKNNYITGSSSLYGGGAIYNEYTSDVSNGVLTVSSSTFDSSGVDLAGTVRTGHGGAIYNKSTATFKDTTFINNKATTLGGAIYNASGTLNIQASAGNTADAKFTGNIAAGVSNAIYLLTGPLNLDAGAGGVITFDDRITSASRDNIININTGTVDSLPATGTVLFNDLVSTASINFGGGTLSLGSDGNTKTHTYLSDANLTMSGGALDIQNNYASDVISLNNLTITGGTLTIDADMAAGTNDKLQIAGVATGTLTINNINFLSDATTANSTMAVVTGGTLTDLILASTSFNSSLYEYILTQNATTKGMYDVKRTSLSGLNYAVKRTDIATRTFDATGNVDVEYALGALAGTSLTIEGNNHNINGLGYAGMSVAAGQTLAINNVGLLNPDGTVATSWNGTSSTTNGGVINNAGNLSITNNVFKNNSTTAYGGVLYNGTASNITTTISGSTFVENSSSASYGGAIYNNTGKLSILDTDFISNTAYRGSAIFNSAAAVTLSINNSEFTLNRSTNRGGAIYNEDVVTLDISGSSFSQNYSGSYGGAIYAESLGQQLKISDTDFISNYSDGNQGGAISIWGGTLQITSGSTFIGNGIDSSNHVLTQFGGAIYNNSIATIKDTTFTGNKALTSGGAIYNASGTLNIQASAGNTADMKFSGNQAAGISNAIHLLAGTLNLNAGEGGVITFDDSITSANRDNPININDSTVDTGLTTGTVIFNNTVSDSSINLKGGTLTLGQDNNSITSTYLSNVNLTLGSGVLDMENNNYNDVINLNNLTIATDSTATLTIDANLATGVNDTINVAGVASGLLKLSHMKITDSIDNILTMTLVNATGAGDISQLSLGSFAAYTNLYKYDFTQKTGSYGVYDVSKTGAGGLNAAVAATAASRVFSATLDESVVAPLGAMGGAGSTLTINGNNHNINGSGYAGMSVASGQTLEINNVGSLNPDGTVATSWNGSSSTSPGGVISNLGNLSITNSVFYNNSKTTTDVWQGGGVLYNNSASNIIISGSTFVKNYSNNSGAIFSEKGILKITDTDFIGNYTTGSSGQGGAILTNNSNLEIDGGLFDGNGFDSDGIIKTYSGGAIYASNSSAIISNAIFSNNAAKDSGGAINGGAEKFTIINTQFNNNYTVSGGGGALSLNYSNGDSSISQNTTFTGNGINSLGEVKTTDGGAIRISMNNSQYTTIDDVRFEDNAATYRGGAVFNIKGILDVTNTDFVGNYTTIFTSNYGGGAIYNFYSNSTNYGTLNISSGSTFTGNGIDGDGSVTTGYGGAIYNQSTATIKDTTFTGNKAKTAGGAIYNASGTLNIQASAGNTTDMKFSGNFANSVSNAIHLASGTLNLNAGEGGLITFDDKITSASRDNLININYSGAESNLTTGTVLFNNTVSDASIKLYDGTLTLGSDSNSTTSTYLSNVNLTLLGGVLDIKNQNTQDLIGLNNFEITDGSLATVSIDTDFANDKYDKISVAGTATGNLQLSNINLVSDSDLENFLMQLIVLGTGASASGLNLEDYIAFTDDYEYDFTQSSTEGAYNVDKIERYPSSGLNGAIESGARNRSYNALADENALYTLGNMGGVNSTLNINANSHEISGVGFGGVNVLAGQTLNVNNAASWSDFASTNGGAINNSGIVTITDSIFENNKASALGGAIYSAGTLNILATAGNSARFSGNTDSTGSNAIYYKSGELNINAGSGATVTFNDAIISESSNNEIKVNDSTVNSTNTIGTVNFNNKINNAKVSIKAGSVNISNTSVNNAKFAMTGGTTTFRNVTFGSNSNIFVNDASAQVLLREINQNGSNYSLTDSFATVSAGNLSVSNSTFKGYSTSTQGGVINNSATTTIVNSFFSNNSASSQGGAIYNSGILNIVANGTDTTFTNNKAAGLLNDIYLAAGSTLNINSGNGGAVYINSGISSADTTAQININNVNSTHPINGSVVLNSAITSSSLNMYNGVLHLSNDGYLNNNNLTMNGGTLSLANGSFGVSNLNTLNLTGNSYLTIDADLTRGLSDRLTAATASSTNGAMLTLSGLNITNDTSSQANLTIADSNVSNYIKLGTSTVSSPIANYNLSYNSSSGSLSVTNSGFNPSVLATGSSALVGNYLNQVNTYNETFANIDSIMSLPRFDRLIMNNRAKTASADTNFVFSPTMLPEEDQGYWVKQFTTFENVPLSNGPNVSNIAYGMLVGKDSATQYIGKGFRGYASAYFGYMGSRQNFSNVSSTQNGGLFGLTGTVYKGDFFAALTANMGSSNGNNYTPSGTDNYTSIMGGLAAKTGYNLEVLGGGLIIQPSLTMSYTFANTFDYKTASGVDISSDPLNAIQLSPGLKLIANLKDGWQPYLSASMVWNFMDKAKFYANNVELPQTSIDPYLEYGFGLQRKWGRFTGFGQAMARSGGRNGVALQFGFRWAIGK